MQLKMLDHWPLRRWQAACAVILIAFGVLLYGGTLKYPFVELDDPLLVTENPAAQALTWTNVKTVFSTYDPELYIPLTFVSYQADATIGGLQPFVFRLHNLLDHVACAWLLVMVTFAITRKRSVALLAGLIFLVHPIQTEAVVWISGRKDLLSTAFFLLSILLYLRYTRRQDGISFGGSLLMFLLGLLAKVTIISLAPLLFVIDAVINRRITKKTVLEKLPYFALAGIFGIVALYGKFDAAPVAPLTRLLVSCTSFVFSLWKILLPVHLSPMYPEAGAITLSSPTFFVPLLVILAGITMSVVLWKKHRMIVLGMIAIALAYAPSFANILKGGEYYLTTDRYAYVPMTIIAVLAALGLERLERRIGHKAAAALATGVIIVLGVLSIRQADRWKDPLTLSAYVVETAPQARIGRLWRGNVLRDAGRIDEAFEQYAVALKIIDDTQVHYNRGLAYQMQGKTGEAMADYRKALELQPAYPLAEINLGQLLYEQGKKDEARTLFSIAAQQAPHLAMPFFNLGVLAGEEKNFTEAIDDYRKALERDPAFDDARENLIVVLIATKQTDEAIEQLRELLRQNPSNSQAMDLLKQLTQK